MPNKFLNRKGIEMKKQKYKLTNTRDRGPSNKALSRHITSQEPAIGLWTDCKNNKKTLSCGGF